MKRAGAGVYLLTKNEKWAFLLGQYSTIFEAEVYAIRRAATWMIEDRLQVQAVIMVEESEIYDFLVKESFISLIPGLGLTIETSVALVNAGIKNWEQTSHNDRWQWRVYPVEKQENLRKYCDFARKVKLFSFW